MTEPRNPQPREPDHDNVTDLEQFKQRFLAETAGMDPHEFIRALGGLTERARPSSRKPLDLPDPPAEPMRYRVRVDLVGAKPPIWRRMTLPGDLTLDKVHDALQVAFGWTNSHLHRFSTSDDRYGSDTEPIVTQADIDEGEDGVLETRVRLDQLVQRVGDSFFYTYDFGDDWEHKVVVESVDALVAGDRGIRCLDGRRAAPPEDIGGIHWYQHLVEVAADPRHPEFADLREQLVALPVGAEAKLDLEAVNRGLDRLAGAEETLAWLREQDTPLSAVILGLGDEAQLHLAGFVTDARLTEPVEITDGEAERATAVFRVFLRHVGGGIRLTSASYLPPASVVAMMKDLDRAGDWIGTANREVQTWPLLELRETATTLGLVRKYRGQLLLTKQGVRLCDAPADLWRYLAARLPVERSEHEREIGILLLLLVAAGEGEPRSHLRDSLNMMAAIVGLSFTGGNELFRPTAIRVVWGTEDVLEWVGSGMLLSRHSELHGLASPGARLLARAALANWG